MSIALCKVKIIKGKILPVLNIEWEFLKDKTSAVDFLVSSSELDFTVIKQKGRVSRLGERGYSFIPDPNGEIVIEIPFGAFKQRVSFSQHIKSFITERLLYANIYLRSGEFGNYDFTFHSGGVFDKERGLILSFGCPQTNNDILVLKKPMTYKQFHKDFFYLKKCDKRQDSKGEIFDGVYIRNEKGKLIYSNNIDEFNELLES